MKKLIPLLFVICLLSSCGSTPPVKEEVPSPPVEIIVPPPPKITYEVETQIYEENACAEDGTLLAQFCFALPELQVFVDGERIQIADTPEQEAALESAARFNNTFDEWLHDDSIREAVSWAEEHYRLDPGFFTGETAMYYSEELTYVPYRTGSLVSIAATYYSYLGGIHPNMVFISWNFDLNSGTFLSVPELAEDPHGFTIAVADLIEKKAAERLVEDGWIEEDRPLSDAYWENYREIMECWSDYAVSFDETGMTVIFSAYELASYAAGAQSFVLTYEELDAYWSETGRQILGLDTNT